MQEQYLRDHREPEGKDTGKSLSKRPPKPFWAMPVRGSEHPGTLMAGRGSIRCGVLPYLIDPRPSSRQGQKRWGLGGAAEFGG